MLGFGGKKNKSNLKVIGVTGTYGKTIVANMIVHILRESGFTVSYINSQGISSDGKNHKDTANANDLKKNSFKEVLEESLSKQLDFLVVEVTSKNILKGMYTDVLFDSGVITNVVGNEEFYETWRHYASTKFDFVKMIDNDGLVVINGEDADVVQWFSEKAHLIKPNVYCYWVTTEELENKYHSIDSLAFTTKDGHEIQVGLTGFHNHLNAYLAVRLCLKYLSMEKIKTALKTFTNVAGRMDLLQTNPNTIIIDSGDSPYVINRSLRFLNTLKNRTNRIISLVGNKGGKSRNKRRVGEIAAELADVVIFSPTDPNTNNTAEINTQLYGYAEKKGGIMVERFGATDELKMITLEGISNKIRNISLAGNKPIVAFDAHDYTGRLDAINFATSIANPGDIIYISGKGDESSIVFNNVEYEWSDYEAVKLALTMGI